MVEYIEYKEKKYPIRISYIALNGFKKDTGKGFADLGEEMDLEYYESLLFHSLRAGCLFEGIEMPFEKKDMELVLDMCMMDFLLLIPKFFPENTAGDSVKKQQPNRQQRRISEKKKK